MTSLVAASAVDHSAVIDAGPEASATVSDSTVSHSTVANVPRDAEELLEADFDDDCNEVDGAEWVDATPFRAHVQQLITDHGLAWRTIAVLVEIPPPAVEHLLLGRHGRFPGRIHPLVARRLYQLTSGMVRQAQTDLAPTGSTRALLNLLTDDGWSIAELAARTGVPAEELESIMNHRQARCTRMTAATIKAAAQVLHHLPAPGRRTPDHRPPVGPARTVPAAARRAA